MTRYVVDASVAVKWFVPEPHYEHANALLLAVHERSAELFAPDLIVAEVGSALFSKAAHGEITHEQARARLAACLAMPISILSSRDLAVSAYEIARAAKSTFYDSLYVAASQAAGAPLVTADATLLRRVRGALPPHLVIGLTDIPL